jgi:serine/threonine-protein kinase
MSPEQLLGREVTVRSDVYSLGLLLYELFTGRRAFTGKKMAELTRQHRDERPVDPSAIVPDLAPAVESTILACLEKDPARRPPTALAVSAMLGGQDPLEAAIAAGVTPSPELVAAAGESERLPRKVAWSALAVILVTAALVPWLWSSFSIVNAVPVEKSPEVLEDRARELIARLGYETGPADSATGLWADDAYFRHARAEEDPPRDWTVLRSGHPPVLRFWYRQSPRPLVSLWTSGNVAWDMPPLRISGMAGAAYDLRGQLVDFYAVPPEVDEAAGEAPQPDWAPLFAEARLEPMALQPAAPRWAPPFFVDTRAAWTGAWPDQPDLPIRIEAAAYRGRPVWFRVVQPWTRPDRMEPYQASTAQRVTQYVGLGLLVLLVGVGTVLARRNLVLGRGDRRGAFRLAASMVGLGLTIWVLEAHHVADLASEAAILARGAGAVLVVSALLWLFYLALEPYVRRLRPATLVSWTRLLSGGFSDAVVGRDVLIGATWGAMITGLSSVVSRVPAWLGLPAEPPASMMLGTLMGPRSVIARVLDFAMGGILLGLGALLLYLILRFVLRRELPTVVAFVVLLTVVATAQSDPLWLGLSVGLVVMASYVFVLLRFGLLAACVGPFFANGFAAFPLTTSFGRWYAGPTLLVIPLLAILAILAFRTALGGSGLRRYLAGENPATRP